MTLGVIPTVSYYGGEKKEGEKMKPYLLHI